MGQWNLFKGSIPLIFQLVQWLNSQYMLTSIPVVDNWWAIKVLQVLYMFKVRDLVSELKWIGIR